MKPNTQRTRRMFLPALLVVAALLGAQTVSTKSGVTATTAPLMFTDYPLDPNNFASLGASPFTQAGTYTINASRDLSDPILIGPDGVTTIAIGRFHSPSDNTVFKDEIAVFTFDSISIPAGVIVQGARNDNSRPIALLSKGDITIDGVVDVGGENGGNADFRTHTSGAGGAAGPGGGGGGGGGGEQGDSSEGISPGSGGSRGVGYARGASGGNGTYGKPGSGGSGGSVVENGGGSGGSYLSDSDEGGGGAFGGNGGTVPRGGATGGTAYGDLAVRLQGGSGGGGAIGFTGRGGGGGGGGGGAVEIGALSRIAISGSVLANGGSGGFGGLSGGGGAGGGIFVHGSAVTFSGSGGLSAAGGSSFRGGGGGGGRVLISASPITGGCFNVAGGSGDGIGSPGVLTLDGTFTPLPYHLAFGQQPPGATPGATISPAVTVRILDQCNNLVTSSTATVTLAFGNNPGGATLGGTTSIAAVGGVATFNNLTLDKPGTGYTLTANSTDLAGATSNNFNITCQAITVDPTTTVLSGGTAGASYSQSFTQAGGIGTTTFSKTAGTLPEGLTLSPGGVLSGTPSRAGTFNFTITATDANGCSGSRAYSATMSCPAVTATVSGGGAVCPGASATVTVNLNGGTAPWTVTLSGGAVQQGSSSTFNFSVSPAETTTYTASATDYYGCPATVSGSATVTVGDTTAPTIICPTPIAVDGSTVLGGATVNFSATAADNCGGAPNVTYSKAPGSLFPFGVTTVTVTANDGRGNSSQCSFTVTVRTPQQQTTLLKTQVQALVTAGALTPNQGAGLTDKLNEIITKLNEGQKGAACNQLSSFIAQVNALVGGKALTSAQGQALISAANNVKANIGC